MNKKKEVKKSVIALENMGLAIKPSQLVEAAEIAKAYLGEFAIADNLLVKTQEYLQREEGRKCSLEEAAIELARALTLTSKGRAIASDAGIDPVLIDEEDRQLRMERVYFKKLPEKIYGWEVVTTNVYPNGKTCGTKVWRQDTDWYYCANKFLTLVGKESAESYQHLVPLNTAAKYTWNGTYTEYVVLRPTFWKTNASRKFIKDTEHDCVNTRLKEAMYTNGVTSDSLISWHVLNMEVSDGDDINPELVKDNGVKEWLDFDEFHMDTSGRDDNGADNLSLAREMFKVRKDLEAEIKYAKEIHAIEMASYYQEEIDSLNETLGDIINTRSGNPQKKKYHLVITGVKECDDVDAIIASIDATIAKLGFKPSQVELITGGEGVIGEVVRAYAMAYKCAYSQFDIMWTRNLTEGEGFIKDCGAAYKRNTEMYDYLAQYDKKGLLVFWNHKKSYINDHFWKAVKVHAEIFDGGYPVIQEEEEIPEASEFIWVDPIEDAEEDYQGVAEAKGETMNI